MVVLATAHFYKACQRILQTLASKSQFLQLWQNLLDAQTHSDRFLSVCRFCLFEHF